MEKERGEQRERRTKREGGSEGRESKKKKVCVLARALGAGVQYGGVKCVKKSAFPPIRKPGAFSTTLKSINSQY